MRKLIEADVQISVEIDEETDHYSSDIFAYDKEVQDAFQEMIDKHGLWGWCSVCVTASWRGVSASSWLGACSYENEQAFRDDTYFADMVNEAIAELNSVVRDWLADADEARAELALDHDIARMRRLHYGDLHWKNPIECPHCKTDLRDWKVGIPFMRTIGISSGDRVVEWKCPDCEGTWPRK